MTLDTNNNEVFGFFLVVESQDNLDNINVRIGAVDHMNSFSLGWVAFVQYERTFWPGKGISLSRSRIHDHIISLRFLGIILRVLRLEVSV
jgi:hypothetical protein